MLQLFEHVFVDELFLIIEPHLRGDPLQGIPRLYDSIHRPSMSGYDPQMGR